ncbi:Flp pilus assembly complex ATPase component TadA [Shewanella sp. 202IG2-18]|uniref:ATPase, T2SS/T4P/T4SS family n=1 Tax=Parashewanella hymeniacidonis TaxID=2807618 RepID=UPI0019601D26|nr:ATPase, T2SS/T4P/T4SS family [Parashewanella hymeniacidonis]MBM7072989.1 Flp pilus assembly complex ATPase component TadA [Parashewanella hymeniacidonis]
MTCSLPNDGRSLALMAYLKMLDEFLTMKSVTEIVINRPKQVMTETVQGWQHHAVDALNFDYCQHLAKLIATYSGQKLDSSHPILSATLPNGERVQIAIPPVTLLGCISFTIRKPAEVCFSLEDYQQQGYFSQCHLSETKYNDDLAKLKQQGDIKAFLEQAIADRKNIIVSGATGSGKTTFFRSLLELVPKHERLISIENVDELQLHRSHTNSVSLFFPQASKALRR